MYPLNDKQRDEVFILIVDDTEHNLQVLGEILTAEGMRFSAAMNGKRALEVVRLRKPDLVLLDIMMPEMDGYEVCTRLKSNPDTADIPVIFLTASSEKESVVQAFATGAADYVTKPFYSAELLARVYAQLALRKTQESLKQSNERLRQSNEMKDRLFSLIAHDLRSPFQTFVSTADLLKYYIDRLTKEQLAQISNNLLESSQKLFSLTDNLLKWARAQMLQGEIVHQTVELYVLVQACLALFESKAQEKKIELVNHAPAEATATVDKELLNTVLRNLISNAVKFTTAGGTITVQTFHKDGKLYCSVADTGVGMDEARLSRLFTRGASMTTAGTADEQGTGLGLLLCRELLERNGGDIIAESVIGNGTTVCFGVPEESFSLHSIMTHEA